MRYKFNEIAINSVEKRIPTEDDKANYIGLEHLESGSLSVSTWGSAVSLKGEKIVMRKGDVLFGKRNTYLRRASIAPHDGLFSAHGMVLRPKPEVIDPSFFPFFVNSDEFFNSTIRISVGSLSPTVNWKDMKELEFDLPPIEKQRELAELLWAANDLKESYKKLIVAADEMLKAKFREMFGKCGKESLQSVCNTFIDGDWIEAKDQAEAGIRLVQTGNVGDGEFIEKEDKSRWISEETFGRLHCTEIFAGDILVSRLPDPIGRACIIPEGIGKAITAVDCSIIRLKPEMLPIFFVAMTRTTDYQSQIKKATTGTTRARISRGNLVC